MKLSDGAVQPAVIATDGSLSLHDRLKTNVFTYAVPAMDRVSHLEHKKKKKSTSECTKTLFAGACGNVVVLFFFPLLLRNESAAEPPSARFSLFLSLRLQRWKKPAVVLVRGHF